MGEKSGDNWESCWYHFRKEMHMHTTITIFHWSFQMNVNVKGGTDQLENKKLDRSKISMQTPKRKDYQLNRMQMMCWRRQIFFFLFHFCCNDNSSPFLFDFYEVKKPERRFLPNKFVNAAYFFYTHDDLISTWFIRPALIVVREKRLFCSFIITIKYQVIYELVLIIACRLDQGFCWCCCGGLIHQSAANGFGKWFIL